MGKPGLPALLNASLARTMFLMVPKISRGVPGLILIPLTEVRAGVVIELASGIDAYPSTSFNNVSSEDTGAPPAPMKHQGGVLLSGFLGTNVLASTPSPKRSLDGAVFNPF